MKGRKHEAILKRYMIIDAVHDVVYAIKGLFLLKLLKLLKLMIKTF